MSFINRPNRKFLSKAKNPYIKVMADGEVRNVVLDEQANADWDTIEKLSVEKVHYDHSMQEGDEAGKPTGEGFDRYEIVDYITYGRQDFVEEMQIKREQRKTVLLKGPAIGSVAAAEALA